MFRPTARGYPREPMEKRRKVSSEQLEEVFSELWQLPGFGTHRGYRPQVDCYRSDDPPAVTVVVDLAGIDPEQISIEVTERTVLISGVRRRPKLNCRVSYRQMEIEDGPFQRRITLAEDVDPNGGGATYDRGLLRVVLPLAEKPPAGSVTIVLGRRRTT